MKSDLKYILKRIIIGVAIALILMLIKSNVFAAPLTFQSGITTCYTYNSYDSTTPNINCGSNVTESSSGGVTRYKIPNFRYNRLRLDITVPSNVPTGYYTMYFNTITRPNDSPIMHVNSGGHIFNCISETEIHNYYGTTSDGSNGSVMVGQPENYICNNVYLTSNTSIQLHFTGQNSFTSDSAYTVFYIAKRFTVNPVENISSVIDQQTQQQHQDAQNTQNAINNVNDSITSDDVPEIESTDLPGSDMEEVERNVLGDFLFIPLNFARNIVNGLSYQCSNLNMGSILGVNINFPCINPQTFLGVALWEIIDILLTGTAMIAFASKIKEIISDFLSLGVGKFNLNFKVFGG